MENKFIITQISTYSFAFLMFFLPLWRLIDNILLGVLMILFFVTKNKTINIFNLIKTSTIVFVIYIALRSFIDHQLANDFSELLKLLPLLLIPFAFNILTKEQVNKGLFFFIFWNFGNASYFFYRSHRILLFYRRKKSEIIKLFKN
jgi:hypothetical protein